MQPNGRDILIGIDAGTSVIKSVAFDLAGRQLAATALPNHYTTRPDGAAFQNMQRTWDDCARTLRDLAELVPDLARRTAAVAVTAQGDGTWLVGKDNAPMTDGWIWLDARAADLARELRALPSDRTRFETTGTGLNACQMGVHLAHMKRHSPDLLAKAEAAMHPKDWLYLNLTGVRAADPSESCFTFGNFRTRSFDDEVIAGLGLTAQRHLLPPIVDGSQTTHPLSALGAAQTGLLAGTPVSLGFVDVVCTAIGAGIYTGAQEDVGCSIIGSTGMHLRPKRAEDVQLSAGATGYVMVLPIAGMVAQIQSNMAATLNIDWILALAADLMAEMGHPPSKADLLARMEGWLAASKPAAMLYHPYISDAGERGPIVNSNARASFIGLNSSHRFADLTRAVIEGLALASRDCYAAMGDLPRELRLTGGAARSNGLRAILAAAMGAPVRISTRVEAGAAGAAMMAAVAIGAYPDMQSCITDWVAPQLSPPEAYDPALATLYSRLYPTYRAAREALEPVWQDLAQRQESPDA